MVTASTPRIGRPPQGPKSGKGSTLTTRITAATRRALEEEAERSGRSMSQVAEIWLDEAREQNARLEKMVGGYDLVVVVKILGDIAKKIYEPEEHLTEFDREALRSAWTYALGKTLPWRPDRITDQIEEEARVLGEACMRLLRQIDLGGESDPAFVAASQRVRSPAENEFSVLRNLGTSIADIIYDAGTAGPPGGAEAATRYWQKVQSALDQLPANGTAAPEIKAAKSSLDHLIRLSDKRVQLTQEASLRGEALAKEHLERDDDA